jgi:TRAP-type C4-dicarboxylate transport system permease small subunit
VVATLTWIVDRLISLSAIFGALALTLVAVVVLIDVIGRLFGAPLGGAQDILQMFMVIIVFGGMALCGQQGGHIAMDVFEDHFPARMNRWLGIIALLLGALIFAGIAWAVIESARISQMLNLATNIIGLPKAFFQWALTGFAILTSVSMLLQAAKGGQPSPGDGPRIREEV